MVRILEFKEFKMRLMEAEGDPPASEPPASPAAIPPPAPDMGAPMMDEPPIPAPTDGPAAGTEVAPTAGEDMRFVFIKDAKDKKWHGTHDKEGGVKRFTQYSVKAEEVEKWIDVHKFSDDKELIMAALSGKRDMPERVYSVLKDEVEDGSLGTDRGTIDIKFDSDEDFSKPSTTDLNVVFLKQVK